MTFLAWLELLRGTTGEAYLFALNRISPYILETFWREGCEPTLEGVIRHCQGGRPDPSREAGRPFLIYSRDECGPSSMSSDQPACA